MRGEISRFFIPLKFFQPNRPRFRMYLQKAGFEMNKTAAILIVLSLSACRVDNALPRSSCNTDADCLNGNTCRSNVCVPVNADDGGVVTSGQCETFPPAACAQPEGMSHPIDRAELERLVTGRWLWCSGDMVSGMPIKFGRKDGIGFELDADAGLWWLLVDGGNGVPVHATGFDSGGPLEFLAASSMLQMNLVESGNSWFTFIVEFTDGPPTHMRLMFEDSAYYVRDETGCGVSAAVDMGNGNADMASSGMFGGACDPNVVLPTSCPAVDGVACSICGAANMASECVQPCHMGGSDCAAPHTCMPLSDYTLAGDCSSFDGYCG